METVCWGIIGCGDVTEVKSGPALQKASGSRLVAVMRRDAAKAADYARRHGVPRWYADADALIADGEVNAIYVATPPNTHEFYAQKVCAAGKPCYVEKPMARNTAEAERMVGAFAAAGLPLFAAYYRRALPRFVQVKALLNAGTLGTLQSVSYRFASDAMRRAPGGLGAPPWRLDAEIAGGGLFLDLGSHALDLLDFFVGPLNNVKGSARSVTGNYPLEDLVVMSFSGAEGCQGSATWDFAAEASADVFVLTGTHAALLFSCFGNEPLRMHRASGQTETFDRPNPPHVQQPLLQTVVDELRGVETGCPSTGATALRTQRVMDAALDAFYEGREDGFWTRPRR